MTDLSRRTFLKTLTATLIATQLPALISLPPKNICWVCLYDEKNQMQTEWTTFESEIINTELENGEDYFINKSEIRFEESRTMWIAKSVAISRDKKTILFEGLLNQEMQMVPGMQPRFGVGDLAMGID